MAELPRFLRRATSATLPAVLALGGLFSDAPKAFSAPPSPPVASASQTSTIPVKDARQLFESLYHDRVVNGIDVEQNLLELSRSARSNSDLALLYGAYEMGMVRYVNQAVREAMNGATLEVDGWQLVNGNYENALKKYADTPYADGITYPGAVARDANGLLSAAHRHGVGLSEYVFKIHIPLDGPSSADIRGLAKFGQTNNTIAMATPLKP